ncbi:outer membrane lipoprotein carrier protein LolA [Odoribacter sp. OttesenSCG-928-L07]|nr:outer membrane lipoprotein carrier protein LolA [Odoribacter sp. OttesenSCG-928-L07]MDL2238885.1 outer membrane lipoprotein carrier protein LolA [Bacteroidales bacterium OttesenSCG-928-L14]MDL2240625.1 outer membrane lipoprotein carrier protein LolA [Bacteroidales bacterium OttesenSCG-928-K22]
MLNKIKYILFLAFIISSIDINAQENNILDKISKTSENTKTMQCSFTQTKNISILAEEFVSKGYMFFSAPDKFRWEYASPYEYIFIMNEKDISIITESSQNNFNTDQNKLFAEISKIMIVGINGSGLEKNESFNVDLQSENNNEYIFKLTPKQKEIKKIFSYILLTFDNTFTVSKIEMIEDTGDNTVIKFSPRIINEPINDEVFKIR